MLKKILIAGILLMMISVVNAKTFTPFNPFIKRLILGKTNEGLVNKLTTDNDFKNYYISNVKFANKIIEFKVGDLFQKYIKKSITTAEQADLFEKMGVRNKAEFDAIALNFRNEAVVFFNKFPELKLMTQNEQKEILVNAYWKLRSDKSISVKFTMVKLITLEECFATWMACNTLCAITCSYDPNYNNCIWTCAGACSVLYGACWFIAE